MSRPLRIQYPDAVYHIMNRGSARRAVFLNRFDYLDFLEILKEVWSRWKIEVYAYCLMGNHYHLCLKTPEAKLSRVMRHINGVYTQRFNRSHRRDGPLFRGRYKAILIEEEEYLGQVVRYIHLNPVEAGLAEKPERYKWSSHKDYMSRKAPPWLSRKTAMAWFETRQAFHEFVCEGNEKTISQLYQRRRWPVILGSEEFFEKAQCKGSKLSKEHIREERRFVRPSIQKIMEVVAMQYRVPLTHLIDGKRGISNEARKLVFWVLRETGDYSHGEIAKAVGLGSDKTVGWACQEVRRKLLKNRKLRQQLNKIQSLIIQPET